MVDEQLREDIEAVAKDVGCELFELDFNGGTFRIVLDRLDRAVTIDDCTDVSRQVSALLDVAGFDPGRFTLEVGSPGLDRKLRDARDYSRFAGSLARLTWADEDGSRFSIVGRLKAVEENGERVLVDPEGKREPFTIAISSIVKARLEIEL